MKFVILRGLKFPNTSFFTANVGNPTTLSDGTKAYSVVGYADSVQDAQIKLYGRSFAFGNS